MKSVQKPTPKIALDFHRQQIQRLLGDNTNINLATLASLESAVTEMKNGWQNRFFPSRSAKRVLQQASGFRRAETGPTSRWVSASLIESMATLRLLELRHPTLHADYQGTLKRVIQSIKETIEHLSEQRRRQNMQGGKTGGQTEAKTMSRPLFKIRDKGFQTSFISTGKPFRGTGSEASSEKKPAPDAKLAAERKRWLSSPGYTLSPKNEDE
jgi:hypothetical protein